ncbi:hypothetical protein AYI68_g1583 [Smittium mucronatum]|uniref:Tc1-like transposase DDE domain-containing protein n=1 Tax=Smittium mucronatum TaxID=133383 RepID=A0A1R0H4W1_9FUNG|nr:hypothetical protein AYI68_g1583 [Smittium mucronatum]
MEKTGHKITNNDRYKIIDMYNSGKTAKEISEILLHKVSTIYSIIKVYQKENRIEKKYKGGLKNKKFKPEYENFIYNKLQEDCRLTLRKLSDLLSDKYNIKLSTSTIQRCCCKFFYNIKPINNSHIIKNDEQSIVSRKEYSAKFAELRAEFSDSDFYFIDEVSLSVTVRSAVSKERSGGNPNAFSTRIRVRNVSTVCAINCDGFALFQKSITAFTQENFSNFLLDLTENLKKQEKTKGVFVLDSSRTISDRNIINFISERGFSVIYTPPYSPYLNPVGNLSTRVIGLTPRMISNSEDELFDNIDKAFSTVTEPECKVYFEDMLKYLDKSSKGESITL